MWNAFGNGSGLHGGGAGGGGNVPSQGWEFVPCSRLERAERGRGKSRSPLRRISSPPTVFSQIFETGGTVGGVGGGGGTPLEVLRGQIWPGHEPQQQQQQSQHTRLKKKFEDLKKRHGHDKEEWMRQKESLLREVADIQGGENRRILLDLKSVLEEVQGEVKREEEKRSDLQLQYTRDRGAWELERAELKCRIAQLEVREGGGVQQAGAGPGSAALLRNSLEVRGGETPTLRREREEQKKLLADTHSTAMDLRCRFESNERDWLREKAELTERFNSERKEWESQLRDMQRKIEELYCEVKAKRKGTGTETGMDSCAQDAEDILLRLSLQSTSTGSSLLSDQSRSEALSSSSQSEPPKHPPLPGFYQRSNISASSSGGSSSGRHSPSYRDNSFCEPNVYGHLAQNDFVEPECEDELRGRDQGRDPQQRNSVVDNQEAVDTADLEAILRGAIGRGVPEKNTPSKGNVNNAHAGPQGSPQNTELIYGSDKKKNTTALNAALKEIARVSEELCSYQDEIRKKSGDKRGKTEERETLLGRVTSRLEIDESPCDLNQIYDDLRALQKESWITWSPENTWQANSKQPESWGTNSNEPNTKTSPEMEPHAPPIPPRTTSWYLSSPTPPDPDLHIPESSMITSRKCHSPCTLVDRKCSSPLVVRKFEAMLQVNEGKVLTDGMVVSCPVPVNSNCNVGCCHNRWSCDGSNFGSSKSSTYSPVQKSFSEVNILTATKDFRLDYRPAVGNLKEGHHMPPTVKELPVDLLLPPACPNIQGSRRNIMLEQKTAEFNRTLFQAEMGRGVEKQDSLTSIDASSVDCHQVCSTVYASGEVVPPREAIFDLRPQCAEVTSDINSECPDTILSHAPFDLAPQNPQVHLRRMGHNPQGHEVRVQQEVTPDLSPLQSEVRLRESRTATTHTPTHHHPEAKLKAGVPQSPSRCSQQRATTETPSSEYNLPADTQPVQSVAGSSPKRARKPQGERTHPAKVGVSPQQPPAEARLRQAGQPGRTTGTSAPQSNTPRPGPRVLNDHPWKPLTLAAYPRPEGSRSNYGAVERILKSYESAAWAQQNPYQQKQTFSIPNLSPRQEEKIIELLDMLDMDPPPVPPAQRNKHTSHTHTSHTHTTHTQLSSQTAAGVKETRLTVQESKESSVSSSSVQKNFSRPARPANRRLPSRWASRSPSSSSSNSSSPCTTPVHHPSFPIQKQTSSFSYSAFHTETVII